MQSPLVTIGIPCFNCAPYLPALLQSIHAQSFTRWEVVAVDDASTDGTAAILRAIRDPRFHVVLGKENLGLGPRLNQIADHAQGEFVARTDADDLMHPERLSRQMACFAQDPALDVCATGAYTLDNHNRILGIRRVPPLARTPLEVMRQNGPSHPTTTAKRSWCQQFRYTGNPRRGEDLDLWIRSIASSRILQLDEPLHFIREDPHFDIAKYRRSMRDHRTVFRRHADLAGSSSNARGLLLRSYGKEWVYGALARAGLAGRVAARRNREMQIHERLAADAALQAAIHGNRCLKPVVTG
jgi:glycosyltransferase involved in cell wall biosynthesis